MAYPFESVTNIDAVFPSAFFALGAASQEPYSLISFCDFIVNSAPSSNSASPASSLDIFII